MELFEIFVVFLFFIYLLTTIGDGSIMQFFKRTMTTYTYFIKESGIDPRFKTRVQLIMKNSRLHAKFNLRETDDQYNADIMMELVDRNIMVKFQDKPEYYPGTNKRMFFSLTWQSNNFYKSAKKQPYCAFDSDNWLYGVPESGLTVEQYREYIVQHEFLHALGFDHQPCDEKTSVNGVCPILYQSTRGCPKGYKCGYQITDFDYTKKINGSTY
jgi:hypothetical protein